MLCLPYAIWDKDRKMLMSMNSIDKRYFNVVFWFKIGRTLDF